MPRAQSAKLIVVGLLIGAAAMGLASCGSSDPTATPVASPGAGYAPSGATPADLEAIRLMAAGAFLSGAAQDAGIHVTGSGSVIAKPDIGVFSFGVEARAESVAAARSRAAESMDAVLKALRNKGIEDQDIQTQFFNIQPIFEYKDPSRSGTPQIVGYVVTNSATAKIRKVAEFGDIIDEAARAGGNEIRVNNIGFSIDDPKPLEAQARALAVKDGMSKAQQMAQAAGVKIGAPVFISEYGGSAAVVRQDAGLVPAAAGTTTPISPGESRITLSVQMTFPVQ